MKPLASILILILAGGLASGYAATPGGDSPDSPEYAGDKWESGQNAGKGFVGWNLVTSGPEAGAKIGLFARGKGNRVDAYRSFDAALEPGQTFEVQVSVNFRNGNKGLDLRGVGEDKTLFNLNIAGDDYKVNLATTGNGSLGNEYSDKTVFTIVFTQKDSMGGTWKITRTGGVNSTHEGNYEGVASGVKFYVIDTDPGPENELWFNHLKITGAKQP